MDIVKKTKEQKIRERIKSLRLMDDDFMTKFFEDDLECTAVVLRIIMDNPNLKVLESVSQWGIKNLQGRSVRLDVKATDDTGKIYDIEVQRADSGAVAERARYNSALLDANLLEASEKTSNLPETYVIFITEHDVLRAGKAVYHINRIVEETGGLFGDGAHIIYVNGEYRGDTPVGDLMHDFHCSNPADMKIKVLADRASYLKEDEKGASKMRSMVQELFKEEIEEAREETKAETIAEEREEFVIEMIKGGKLTLEEMAAYSHTSVEEVKQIAEKMAASAVPAENA